MSVELYQDHLQRRQDAQLLARGVHVQPDRIADDVRGENKLAHVLPIGGELDDAGRAGLKHPYAIEVFVGIDCDRSGQRVVRYHTVERKRAGSRCELRDAPVRKEAHQVATAKVFRFDGSDQLPGAFGDTWGSALQNVIQKPTTSNIKKILSTFQGQIEGKFGS